MPEFRKRRRNTKAELFAALLGCVGLLALLVLAVVCVRAAWDMYGKFVAADQAHTQADAQLAQLQAQYNDVTAQVGELNSTRGQEAQVRERYGVAKPGEGEIDIVRQAASTTAGQSGGQNWWERLWHALFVW